MSSTAGKVREPVLRVSAIARAFAPTSNSGEWIMGATDDLVFSWGQTPLRSPTVFNYFRPGYVPSGSLAAGRSLVTPEMHLTHHSEAKAETNSCYGFCLSWWDRIFGTYRAAPAAGLDGVVLGVPGYRAAPDQRLDRLLLQPLRD